MHILQYAILPNEVSEIIVCIIEVETYMRVVFTGIFIMLHIHDEVRNIRANEFVQRLKTEFINYRSLALHM